MPPRDGRCRARALRFLDPQSGVPVGHGALSPDCRPGEAPRIRRRPALLPAARQPMRILALALAAAVAHPLWGSDVETQHAYDVTLPLKPRVELILHSRVRTQPGGLGFYQVRAGPTVSWDAAPRISLLGGYYYAQQERKIDNDFIGGHRLFGGAELSLMDTRKLSVDQRFLTERFLSNAADDFNRYRLRSRLSAKSSVAPYTSHELFFDAQGWRSNRHSVGVRWRFLPALQVELAYLYEHRRTGVGPNRHVWFTSVHWKKSSRGAGSEL